MRGAGSEAKLGIYENCKTLLGLQRWRYACWESVAKRCAIRAMSGLKTVSLLKRQKSGLEITEVGCLSSLWG